MENVWVKIHFLLSLSIISDSEKEKFVDLFFVLLWLFSISIRYVSTDITSLSWIEKEYSIIIILINITSGYMIEASKVIEALKVIVSFKTTEAFIYFVICVICVILCRIVSQSLLAGLQG